MTPDIRRLSERKRRGEELSAEEIHGLVEAFTAGEIDDAPMAAWLMAVCCAGMTEEEAWALTDAMARSGEMLDLSGVGRPTVDKHSTGGVGDKVTLIAGPVAAACGACVAKMSGRGLGHTGGTIDKLEAVPGLRTDLSAERFLAQAREVGLVIAAQSASLAPADGKMYALRDATGTVDSPALIAASIMSKKIAAGSAAIVLDVTVGSGAFMRGADEARRAAEQETKRLQAINDAEVLKREAQMLAQQNAALEAELRNRQDELDEAILRLDAEARQLQPFPLPEPAEPRYRGMMSGSLLRHIAERASTCREALDMIEDFVKRGYWAGGDVNGSHWLFVDRTGTILEVSNNARHVVSKVHDGKVYFSRFVDGAAARKLRESEGPVDFALFHGVARDKSMCFKSSIAGMTAEIYPAHPELLTCAWISLPVRAASFPILMGQSGTPGALLNGEAYDLGTKAQGKTRLWETLEQTAHASKELLREKVSACLAAGETRQAADRIEQWSRAQTAMLLEVLQALPQEESTRQ